MDELQYEYESIKAETSIKTKKQKLETFQEKISKLKFLDPACGSGNFLTQTYLELRNIENEIIKELVRIDKRQIDNQIQLGQDIANPIKVSINQFYGIEINDFAVSVAKTALWIAEHQMFEKTRAITYMKDEFLPLRTYTNIVEGNALRIDWNAVIPNNLCDYIMGNPPFSGARYMDQKQKEDMLLVFGNIPNVGNLDFVCAWYKKAFDYIHKTNILAAFVSTNSITQGEQVSPLWKNLMESGLEIIFAYRTFIWDSEANLKAHVHCVIIGFTEGPYKKDKFIFETTSRPIKANNINGYLIDAENIFVENKSTPISKNVPQARSGNKPIDDGNYLFTPEEYEEFIKKEPLSKPFFRPWIGSYEFINKKTRYCLWLGEVKPEDLRKMPLCLERIKKVKEFRLKSKSKGTNKLAEKPTRFHVETILTKPFLVLPLTSSERRRYVPIGFMTPNYLASNLVVVVADASIYDFGILTSNIFMAWMRAVCGRLKSDYRITKDNVYNNFPWPTPNETQKEKIKQTAQQILNVREKFLNSSYADLYDELTMPIDLRKAHIENDKAVMEAYGFNWKKMSEADCVAELMKMYQKLVEEEK